MLDLLGGVPCPQLPPGTGPSASCPAGRRVVEARHRHRTRHGFEAFGVHEVEPAGLGGVEAPVVGIQTILDRLQLGGDSRAELPLDDLVDATMVLEVLCLLPDELAHVGGELGVGDVVGDGPIGPDEIRLEVRHRQRERHEVGLTDGIHTGQYVVEFVGELELHLADRDVGHFRILDGYSQPLFLNWRYSSATAMAVMLSTNG